MTRKAKITLGICSALVAGVVIALLVAPEKSKEVGNRIKKGTGKWVDKLGNIFSKAAHDALAEIPRKNYAKNLENEY